MSWATVTGRIQSVTGLIAAHTNSGTSGNGNSRITKTKTRSKLKAGRGASTANGAGYGSGAGGSSKEILGFELLNMPKKDLLNAVTEISMALKELDYVSNQNTGAAVKVSDFSDVKQFIGEVSERELLEAVEKEKKQIKPLESADSTSIGTNSRTAARGRGRGRTNAGSSGADMDRETPPPSADSTFTNRGTTTGTAGTEDTSVSPSSESSISSASAGGLVTIGAKYGYPAPPALSSYNGKIGRSFHSSPYNPSTPILPNSQVAYCPGKHSDSGRYNAAQSEWILCRVLRIITETRFEIQDPEPDELHPQGQIFRANSKEVILVPLHLLSSIALSKLKEYKPGTRVLAKYPETTTFYPAEVMESKGGVCKLRFEGEEEIGKLTPVDRVFVLPSPK